MKYFIVVNPTSGRGRAKKLIPEIKRAFSDLGLNFDLSVTQAPWHAAELAELAARRGYDVIACAGGDGTVNEVVNGLMFAQSQGLRHTVLGLIPVGRGNDLAASLRLPSDLRESVQLLKTGTRRWMDVGIARSDELPEGRYFCNCVGVGFDAVGTILSQKITYVGGMLAYFIASIQTIFTYQALAPTLKIDMDNRQITQQSLMVSVMNGRRIGGGFLTAPDACVDDGLLDLCIARSVGRLRMFFLISHFMNGTQASQPEIRMAQAKKIKITAVEGTMPVQIDGDIFCEQGHNLDIEILPKQLQVMGAAV